MCQSIILVLVPKPPDIFEQLYFPNFINSRNLLSWNHNFFNGLVLQLSIFIETVSSISSDSKPSQQEKQRYKK